MVNAFLNTLSSPESRAYAEYLIIKLLPDVDTNELVQIDSLLAFVERAIGANPSWRDPSQDSDKYKPIDVYLESLEDSSLKEFAAYMAPRLLGSNSDSRDIENVVKFLKTHIAKEGLRPAAAPSSQSNKDDALELLEMANVGAMLENLL